ncbi:MAG: hypothetical protein ISS66_15310 [Desulfobacteraceae bacterium]|nr:hypothetical protein [Desulfobacteraceae bacterium]
MTKEQITFNVLFRSPKYPVIVITDDGLASAYNIQQLGTLCVLSEPFDDDDNIKVIDSNGEEFIYYPEHTSLIPAIINRKWTKKRIIELYNNSTHATESGEEYPLKSLSSKRLSRIIGDICELLKS